MKITFWSPIHGQPGNSCNMLAIANYSTLKYQFNNLLTQTSFSMNNLERPLLGKTPAKQEFFQDVGIDALVRSIKSGPLQENDFYDATISLMNNKLNLLLGTTKCNQVFYENDTEKVIINIINYASKYYDNIFIDTNSGKSSFTPKILESSDLIIVNLCQNRSVLDDFFSKFDLDKKKVFFLIGNYDSRSKNNMANLRKKYKLMNDKNSAFIPYCTEFGDANSDGTVIDFFERNFEATKNDRNKYFMESVDAATQKIFKNIIRKGNAV